MKRLLTMMVAAFFGCPLFATTWYVNGTSGSDGYSGKSSGSAKKTIQAAIDASSSGDAIFVAAGTYDPINAVGKVLTIRGVSGASMTIIDGKGTKRCAWLSDEEGDFGPPSESSGAFASVLEGFTLKNGWSTLERVSNNDGAGVRGGTVRNCIMEGGHSYFGGGASCAKLFRCIIRDNISEDDGGGVMECIVYDSLICRNEAHNEFGGQAGSAASCSQLYNCTVTENVATGTNEDVAAIDYYMTVCNCIIWGNTDTSGNAADVFYSDVYNCCTSDPKFVDGANGNYRLAVNSPCIDAGDSVYVVGSCDLDGNARIENGKVDIGCYESAARSSAAHLYMVIDLSGGTMASSYPVSYLDAVPAGGWTDEYKTTKLVMRRIEPGMFMMGSPAGEIGRNDDADTQHKVTITKPYYIGVFEVTQRQWELVMGANPSYFAGAKRPVETVSYDAIRGVKLGAEWPKSQNVDEGSFLANIRRRAKLEAFDLPTEAQWEFACRAGTTTAWNSSKDIVNGDVDAELGKVGWYGGNAAETHDVGMLAPNAWGLYDMHGNVFEWCLDYYDWYSAVAVTDPVGPTEPNEEINYDYARIIKGGSYERLAHDCRSGSHGGYASYRVGHLGGDFGLRLAMTCNESSGVLSGLMAHYRFDGNANDSSANGYNLTACEDCGVPVLTYDRNGNANSAYLFDGSKAQRLGNVDEVQRMNAPRSTFTFALWFQTEASYADYGAGWAWNLGNYAFAPINGDVIESGLAGLGVKVGRDGIEVVEHSGFYMPTVLSYHETIGTAWNHLAVTIENDGKPILYLNGVKVGEGEKTDRVKCVWADAVGGLDWGYYTGKVDDLCIYNRALSAEEVKALYEGDDALETWYVNGTSGSDDYSGKSPALAKKTIQAAIDAASSGDTILVAAGTYAPINATGKKLTIRSTAGAARTHIDGEKKSRCALLSLESGWFAPPSESSGAFDTVLEGFTLVNGLASMTRDEEDNGGGGVCGGCVIGCVIRQCFAYGGGGASNAKLHRCMVVENTSNDDAGGCHMCIVYDSLICRNKALNEYGGGAGSAATASVLYNCTLTQNVAYENDCDEVGAIDYYMSAYNCIVWANVTDKGRTANITSAWGEYYGDNVNNYELDPHFVDAANGDYRLSANSPCVDAGDNSYVTSETDLDGKARIVNGKVDIGCYEYQGGQVLSEYSVTFNANGGSCSISSKQYTNGSAVGTLPKATRDGYEFLGWFTAAVGGTQVTVDTVVTRDVTFYAHWKRIGSTADEEIISGKKITISTGLKGYKASGLPKGLVYDTKTGKITGTATKVTASEGVVVKFTKTGAEPEELTLVVRKEDVSAGCEGLEDEVFPAGVVSAAAGIPLQLDTETGVKSVTVTKLPAGMKYDSKKGVITGTPTTAGDYKVVLSVTTKTGEKKTVKIPVTVEAMPTMASGTFSGFVSVDEDNLGTFKLTASSAGKLTAKVVTAAGTYSFSKTGWDSVADGVYSAKLKSSKGDVLTLVLDSTAAWDANQLSGSLTTAAVAKTKKTAAVPSRTYDVSAQRHAFGKAWYFTATGDTTAGWMLSYASSASAAKLTVSLKADGSTSVSGTLPGLKDSKGKALKISASGYANVGGMKDGAILADFAPVLSVNKVKTVLAITANLWFDRSNTHAEGVGQARLVR